MLSTAEIRSIIHDVLVAKLSRPEAAVKFNVKLNLVNSLLSQYKKKDGFLLLHQQKEEARKNKLRAVLDQSDYIVS